MSVSECSVCLEHFESDGAYRDHLQYHQRRATELMQELQACLRHISAQPRPVSAQSSALPGPSPNQAVENQSRPRSWKCPHPDCTGKLKGASFDRRKDLVRHAESHKDCEERCLFCNVLILRVRKYFTHYDACPTRLEQQQAGTLSEEKDKQMRENRRTLHQAVDLWLEEMLNSTTSNREGGHRRTIPTRRKRTRVTRSNNAQTNCHLQPSIGHVPLPIDASTIHTDATNLNNCELDGVNLDDMIANQVFPNNDINDFSQGMDPDCNMALPSFDLSTIDRHGLQLRPSISMSYTIDEPYFNLDYPPIESGADILAGQDVHGIDAASEHHQRNHTSTEQRFGN